jgi:DNA ligase D-like protein (predicted ligase)
MNVYRPMLAKSADAPFSSPDWLYEIKWDGIRAISYVVGDLSIRSRSGKELRSSFPEFEELRSLASNVVVDGEIVMMHDGKPDFQALMERLQQNTPRLISAPEKGEVATYVVFDILEKEGKSLTGLPLFQRKTILRSELKEGGHVVLSEYIQEKGEEYYAAATRIGLEGIMAKRKDSLYQPGVRSGDWLKIKEEKECDCVILGYTKGQGKREETLGALLLGLFDDGKLVYVGKVGTGFGDSELERLKALLSGLVESQPPLDVSIPEEMTWVRPEVVCRVGYQMVTKDLRLRMPRFHGVRTDKSPEECTVEQLASGTLRSYRE